MDGPRDLGEWQKQVLAKTYSATKIAEMADDFRKKFPRMRHPAVEALFTKDAPK